VSLHNLAYMLCAQHNGMCIFFQQISHNLDDTKGTGGSLSPKPYQWYDSSI